MFMLSIIFSLLGGWILGLFGFDSLLIAGMAELFGVTMTGAGYYTIFGLVGMARSIAIRMRQPVSVSKTMQDLKETRNKGE